MTDRRVSADNHDGLRTSQLPLSSDFVEESQEDPERLKADIQKHLTHLRLPSFAGESSPAGLEKDRIRAIHALQRQDVVQRELTALAGKLPKLLKNIANGKEVRPEAIHPELVPVRADEDTGDLFRFATLFWSVPVSKGYGRRMRYLVRDRSNGKLVGVFGLTDPVFNLRARDAWIGWRVDQRRSGLVHVMDAYVVGAVPPYSQLLGGKLVAALMGSAEVGQMFSRRYAETQGIISGQRKAARLALITVTSALGRSSLYNRLRLLSQRDPAGQRRTLVELIRIGSTEGYGHFHLSESLFRRLRRVAQQAGLEYADRHEYGEGPNWRIRLSRVALAKIGLDPELLKHGIARDIYMMPLATNCRGFLSGQDENPLLDRPNADEIAKAAIERWILPRAQRRPDFVNFANNDVLRALTVPNDN